VSAARTANGALEVQARASDAGAAGAPLALYAAITENGLVTNVKAGENRGETLAHDHVVRHWLKPVPLKDGSANLGQAIGVTPEQLKKGLNVVAFVQNMRTGEVLQALTTGNCKPL